MFLKLKVWVPDMLANSRFPQAFDCYKKAYDYNIDKYFPNLLDSLQV